MSILPEGGIFLNECFITRKSIFFENLFVKNTVVNRRNYFSEVCLAIFFIIKTSCFLSKIDNNLE